MFKKLVLLTSLLTVLPVFASDEINVIDITEIGKQNQIFIDAQIQSQIKEIKKELQSLEVGVQSDTKELVKSVVKNKTNNV